MMHMVLLFLLISQTTGDLITNYNTTEVLEYLPDDAARNFFLQHFYFLPDGQLRRKEGDRNPPDEPDETDAWIFDHFYPADDGKIYPLNGREVRPRAFDSDRETVFRLYIKDQPSYEILRLNQPESVLKSRFNRRKQTRFIIHGFRGDGNAELNTLIRKNYLEIGAYNVIVVDWGEGSGNLFTYGLARSRVREVGRTVSGLIDTLVNATGTLLHGIQLIGFSLGAHVAGNAGKFQSGKLYSIIGLDPAGPSFSYGDGDRLKDTDAQAVIVIHTSRLGFKQRLGTVDFYVNKSFRQPGCWNWDQLFKPCSHQRAYHLFAESLVSFHGFRGRLCSKLKIYTFSVECEQKKDKEESFGGEPSYAIDMSPGAYAFDTNSEPPFAISTRKQTNTTSRGDIAKPIKPNNQNSSNIVAQLNVYINVSFAVEIGKS